MVGVKHIRQVCTAGYWLAINWSTAGGQNDCCSVHINWVYFVSPFVCLKHAASDNSVSITSKLLYKEHLVTTVVEVYAFQSIHWNLVAIDCRAIWQNYCSILFYILYQDVCSTIILFFVFPVYEILLCEVLPEMFWYTWDAVTINGTKC